MTEHFTTLEPQNRRFLCGSETLFCGFYNSKIGISLSFKIVKGPVGYNFFLC